MFVLGVTLRWMLWGLALGVFAALSWGLLLGAIMWLSGDGAVGLVTGPLHWVATFLVGWSLVALPLGAVLALWVWLVQSHPVLDERPASILVGVVACALVTTAWVSLLGWIWFGGDVWAGSRWLFLLVVFLGIAVYLLLPRVLIKTLGRRAIGNSALQRPPAAH